MDSIAFCATFKVTNIRGFERPEVLLNLCHHAAVGFQASVSEFQFQIPPSPAFVHVAEVDVGIMDDVGDSVAGAEIRVEVELGEIERANPAMTESHALCRHGKVDGPALFLIMEARRHELERIHAGVNDPTAVTSTMGCGPVGVGDFPDVPIPTVEKKVVQKQAEFLGSETVHARQRDIASTYHPRRSNPEGFACRSHCRAMEPAWELH